MYHVIGLGNPGNEYDQTRHNIGRDVTRDYVRQQGVTDWSKDKLAQALHADNKDAEFWLPETFMNRSGETARYLVEKRGVPPRELVVVHDDVDLPLGTVKVSVGRGHGGHNGIRSIEQALKSKEFIRLRIGITPTSFWTGQVKRPGGGVALNKFVLGPFSKRELTTLDKNKPTLFAALECILTDGVSVAMNTYN